jgi:hypothetical protein
MDRKTKSSFESFQTYIKKRLVKKKLKCGFPFRKNLIHI